MKFTGLKLELERTDDAAVVVARGEIDCSTAPALSDALRRVTFEGEGPVAIDLCAVTFMDSSGISVLLNAVRRLAQRDRRLSVVCPPGPLLRLFELTGLLSTLDIHSTRNEALATHAG